MSVRPFHCMLTREAGWVAFSRPALLSGGCQATVSCDYCIFCIKAVFCFVDGCGCVPWPQSRRLLGFSSLWEAEHLCDFPLRLSTNTVKLCWLWCRVNIVMVEHRIVLGQPLGWLEGRIHGGVWAVIAPSSCHKPFFTQRPLSLLEAQPSRNERDDELQLVMSAEIWSQSF